MRVLLIVPQNNEHHHFLAALHDQNVVVDDMRLGALKAARVEELDVIVAKRGHGKAQFAAQTQYLLSRCNNVDLVICAGAAGAMDPME